MGKTFKRPNGSQTYTVRALKYHHFSGRTFVEILCDTPLGRRHVAYEDIVRMKEVT